jgi:hypothetical protein
MRFLGVFLAMECYAVPIGNLHTWLAEEPVNRKRRYLSYLLRLWQESAGDPAGGDSLWRASLEKPQSDIRQGFASLADLFAFLERETGTPSPSLERSDDEKCQRPAIPE